MDIFSPIAKKKIFLKDELEKDLSTLSQYISDIGVIRILGGKPLLNPEVPQIVEMTRRIYLFFIIRLVTNGLLLSNMKSNFFMILKERRIEVHISYYLPIRKYKNDIEKVHHITTL